MDLATAISFGSLAEVTNIGTETCAAAFRTVDEPTRYRPGAHRCHRSPLGGGRGPVEGFGGASHLSEHRHPRRFCARQAQSHVSCRRCYHELHTRKGGSHAGRAQRLIVLPTGYACAREAPPQGAVSGIPAALLCRREPKCQDVLRRNILHGDPRWKPLTRRKRTCRRSRMFLRSSLDMR